MKIHLHADLNGILPLRRQVEIEAPEEATVAEVLELYRKKYKADKALSRMGGVCIVVNGARGSLKQELKENDRVRLFKTVIRG